MKLNKTGGRQENKESKLFESYTWKISGEKKKKGKKEKIRKEKNRNH